MLRIEQLEARALPATVSLRVAVYNIASANGAPRAGLETILQAIGNEAAYAAARPIDVLALQEVEGQATTTQNVVSLLNSIYGANAYARGSVNGATNGSGTQGLVYRTSTIQLVAEALVSTPAVNIGGSNYTAARQPIRHQLQPVGGSASDTFYVYNSHYKADSTSFDQKVRQAEATNIRADADALGQGKNILYVGDFNAYASTETFYGTILSGAGNGQAFDPIGRPGAWHSSPNSFREILTQAPSSSPPAGFTGGGLDDRFDFQLISGELADGIGLEYRAGTYHTFGNNGSVPANGSINSAGNTALPGLANRTTVLDLLTTVTDHLPVVADYTFTTGNAPTIGSFAIDPPTVAVGGEIVLTASNVAVGIGTIAAVNFYRENNGVAGLQIGADAVVGGGAQSGTTWTLPASTTGLAAGVYSYYAVATDNSNNTSGVVSSSLTITNPAVAGPILTWDVGGQTNFGTQGLAADFVAGGISSSPGLTRGASVGVTGSAASNAWGGNLWPATSAAGTSADKSVAFGFTVAAGKSASLSSVGMNYRHSATGPANGFWQFQIDSGAWTTIGDFASQFPSASSSGASMAVLNLSGVASLQQLSAGTSVKLRLIPYGATTDNGTWYVYDLTGDDLILNGSIRSATTTILSATPNATTGGSLVTLTATVAPSPGSAGTVTFLDGGSPLAGGSNVAVAGNVATLQIATLAVATHTLTATYSGAAGFAPSTSNSLSYVVGTAPTVVSVAVNGNFPELAGPQRSRVVSLQVDFDQPVQLDVDAFALALHANNVAFGGVPGPLGGLPTELVIATTDNIAFVVTFADNTEPSPVPADGLNSLSDGVYDFVVNAAKVHPIGVPEIDAAANSTTVFHRLFGDADGAASVGAAFTAIVAVDDNFNFRSSFNNAATYAAWFDYDGDGAIGVADNFQFRSRFNKPLTWTA